MSIEAMGGPPTLEFFEHTDLMKLEYFPSNWVGDTPFSMTFPEGETIVAVLPLMNERLYGGSFEMTFKDGTISRAIRGEGFQALGGDKTLVSHHGQLKAVPVFQGPVARAYQEWWVEQAEKDEGAS